MTHAKNLRMKYGGSADSSTANQHGNEIEQRQRARQLNSARLPVLMRYFASPVPLRLTVCGLVGSPSEMLNVPMGVPM